jgi:hypothetical protein
VPPVISIQDASLNEHLVIETIIFFLLRNFINHMGLITLKEYQCLSLIEI